jgi:sulfite reductase (NADPH) flavoprotein alpha-component
LYDLIANKNAIFYVCGDATTMQKSVLTAWHEIVRDVGKKSDAEAQHFITQLMTEKRYVVDTWG